jgi:predicted DNA-binding transcriptional regulator AlpA
LNQIIIDDPVIRTWKGAAQVTGMSVSTLKRWARDRAFPAPLELGPASIGWRRSVLEHFLQTRPARRAGTED